MKNISTLPHDLLGAHVSIAGGVANAPGRAASLPAKAFQIFTKNQNQWRGKPLTRADAADWFEQLHKHDLSTQHVCSHDSYLINLASPDKTLLRRSCAAFVDEIERCARLAIPALVFHPGSHMGRGEMTGLTAVAHSLDRCIEDAASGGVDGVADVLLCIETTAGQGTNLGYRFEHIRDIFAASHYPERLGACLDTCHIFAAGYRLDSPYQIRKTLSAFQTKVGLEKIKVIHVNDSRRECGSRVDRHARIGRGEIGSVSLRTILRSQRLRHAIKVLETPGGEEAYREDLEKLRRLVRRRRG
jgi:deoxyribonuclease-4